MNPENSFPFSGGIRFSENHFREISKLVAELYTLKNQPISINRSLLTKSQRLDGEIF